MRTSIQKTSKFLNNHQGFSLIEILVALLLASLVFLAVPSGDSAQKHRDLTAAIEDIDRSIRFAANEAILRNTVVRLRFALDKEPVEYYVEYGPPGNMPLPDMPDLTSPSLSEEKAMKDKTSALDKQFTKVEEFEEIKNEVSPDVSFIGVGSTFQKKLITEAEASIYFYPTGEKDGALIFFATDEEIAFLEIEPFLSDTNTVYEPLRTDSVAKVRDILQTRMEEVFKEWQVR